MPPPHSAVFMHQARQRAHDDANRHNGSMRSFLLRLWGTITPFDPSAIRVASSLRRAAVVLICFFAAYHLLDTRAAISAASSALIVGMLDKGSSPRRTWHTMASGAVSLAIVTILSGMVSSSPWLVLTLMCLLALGGGISYGVDSRAPQIFTFSALMCATNLVNPVSPRESLVSAAAVLIAGGLQTFLAWASAPLVADKPEREAAVQALRAIADYAEAMSHGETNDQEYAIAASAAFANVNGLLARSDLSAGTRGRFAAVLTDADLVRMEARGFASRLRQDRPVNPTAISLTKEAFGQSATVLRSCAVHISHPSDAGEVVLMNQVIDLRNELGRDSGLQHSTSRTAEALQEGLLDLPTHTQNLLSVDRSTRKHRPNKQPLRDRIRASIHPGSRPFQYGVRMATGAFLGFLIGHLLHLSHPSWAAVTAMMILRPDTGPTPARTVQQAFGVVIGAIIMVPIAAIAGQSLWLYGIAMAVVVLATYLLIQVNYPSQVAMLTTTMVLLMSISGQDPAHLAFQRMTDVLTGCAVGLVIALVFPMWHRSFLALDAAAYARAGSRWIQELAVIVAETAETGMPAEVNGPGLKKARELGLQARGAQLEVSSTLQTALLEPPSRRVNAAEIGSIVAAIGRCHESILTIELLLRHGHLADQWVSEMCEATSIELANVGDQLDELGRNRRLWEIRPTVRDDDSNDTDRPNVTVSPDITTSLPPLQGEDSMTVTALVSLRAARAAIHVVERVTHHSARPVAS